MRERHRLPGVEGVRSVVGCRSVDPPRARPTRSRGNRVSADPPIHPRPLNFEKVRRNADAPVRADGRPEVVRSRHTREGPTVKLDRRGSDEARRAANKAAEATKAAAERLSSEEEEKRRDKDRNRRRRETDRARRAAAREAALAERQEEQAAKAAAEQLARDEKTREEEERNRKRREADRRRRAAASAEAQAAETAKAREEAARSSDGSRAVNPPREVAGYDERDSEPAMPPPQLVVDPPPPPPPPPRREHLPSRDAGGMTTQRSHTPPPHAPPKGPGVPESRVFVSGRRPTLWERVKELFRP